MSPIIAARGLVKDYGKVRAVDGLDLIIPQGICFGLLGPNGAGKTTTIEMIEGVIEPTAGEIYYQGALRDRQFRHQVGIQFQATALQEFLTVRETIQLFHDLYDAPLEMDEVITLCALQDLLDRDNKKLSGGQRQRLLLALALVNDPQVIFLDEPTTGLDPQARRNFWDLIKLIRTRNKTIVLTTHYMDEAYELCDQIAIVDKGRVIAEGTPTELLKNHFGNSVIQFPEQEIGPELRNIFAEACVVRQGWVEIQTADPHVTITQLLQKNVSLKNMRLRAWNLEDLFIALTGNQLRQ